VIAVYSQREASAARRSRRTAVALSARSKRRVAVVDLDLQFGDVGVALDLRSANSMIDLVAHDEQIDAGIVEDVFMKHESGVHVSSRRSTSARRIQPTRSGSSGHRRSARPLRLHRVRSLVELDDLTLGIRERRTDRARHDTELHRSKNIRRVIAATPSSGTPPYRAESAPR